MTSEQCKKLLPILQAFSEGKKVQYRRQDGTWADDPDCNFDPRWEYRIKPEPMELELWVDKLGGVAKVAIGSDEQGWLKDGFTKKLFREVIQ